MDEEFVVQIIEGEVEVDQFVDVQILQTRVVRNNDVGDAIDGEERTIVPADLGEEKVDLVFEDQLVYLELDFEGFE